MRTDNLDKFLGMLSEMTIIINDISQSDYDIKTLSIRLNQLLSAGDTVALNLSHEEKEQYLDECTNIPQVVDTINFYNRNNQIIEIEIKLNEEETIGSIGDTINHINKAMIQLREMYEKLRMIEGDKVHTLLLLTSLGGHLENFEKLLSEYTGGDDTRLPAIEPYFTSRDKALAFLKAIDSSRDKISVFGKLRQKGIITNLSALVRGCADIGIINEKANSVKRSIERWMKNNS